MRTQRQIEASRINGAKSRGPVTAAGRQKSSRNSRRHCMYAKDVPVSTLFPMPPDSGMDDLSVSSDPDPLVQAALDAHRGLLRIIHLQTRIVNDEVARQRLIHPAETDKTILALAYQRLADEAGTIEALLRFEGVAYRRWERALERIERWRGRQPLMFHPAESGEEIRSEIEKNEIRKTNPRPVSCENEKNEICGTNPTTPNPSVQINKAKQAYNRRVANHNEENLHPARIHRHCGSRADPRSNNEAAHARPDPPLLKRHPSRRLSRRAFG